ncbi:MAG: efflux RND transporter periplasmic adaptor subunit [Chromatiaceae bacterium]|nr:efflux RND transporter periplasmic adaptor subunit [Chromatiaceae bacterium]
MEKGALDGLKIDRTRERDYSPGRWLILVVSAVLTLLAAWWWLGRSAVPEVRTVTAREIGAAQSTVLNASGYVTARRQATVSSKVTGKVMEVFIEEGMQVQQDQVLARLDDSNVRVSLRLAEAQLEAARSALRETQALLTEAAHKLNRTLKLVKRGVASAADLDAAQSGKDSLAARLESQRADVIVAQRQVDVWQQQIDDTIIRAPFAGIIVAKNAQPGEMISPLSAGGGFTRTGIGTLVDMSSLEIEVDVNESYINRVSAGQAVTAVLDAYPDWRIPAQVIAIIPTADRQRATVAVRIGFDELDPRILPDMGVKVAFQEAEQSSEQARGVVVPAAALRQDKGKDIVMVVDNGRVERRAVAVAERRDAEVVLSAGVNPGESVITEGPAELADGDSVREKH